MNKLHISKFFAAIVAALVLTLSAGLTSALAFSGPWGPAGMAPQTPADAARVMGVNADDSLFLTVLYPAPGDQTVIGWVLGTNSSQDASRRLSANTLPSGVCVDWDPGASTLTGNRAWEVELANKWHRALLTSQGSFVGLKGTFYWTPCVQDGTPVNTGGQPSNPNNGNAVAPPRGASRFFAETGHNVQGPFLDYWTAHGGLAINGYPLSDERVETLNGQPYVVQYFERVRMEWHAELNPPQVLLGQFGRQIHANKYGRDTDAPVANDGKGLFFPETGHNLSGGFLTYWQQNGGLAQFGYPISEVKQETDGNWTGWVQYFERARFEWHEEISPAGVLLGQFGRAIMDGTASAQPSNNQPNQSTGCINTPDVAASRIGGSAGQWSKMSDGGLKYQGGELSFTVPAGHVVVDPSGKHTAGQSVKASVFSLYCGN